MEKRSIFKLDFSPEWNGVEIYKLSYLFVNPFGALVFLFVASIVSFFDGGKEFAKRVDKRYDVVNEYIYYKF